MKNKISLSLLEAIRLELSDDEIHDNYSGRGMAGMTCFGISGSNIMGKVAAILGSIYDMPDEVAEFVGMLALAKEDSLGLGKILYFPGYASPKTTEE